MTAPSDTSVLEAQLAELNARVAYIEAYLRATSATMGIVEPIAVVVQDSPRSIAPIQAPVTAWTEPPPTVVPPTTPDVVRTDQPIRVLALTGGIALLLGLGFFVVYAIEQAWIPPSVRFVLAAIASALLTLAAWPIARRGYDAVAGAIGGAGLGGWFAAWLVAHHVHDLVSVGQTFAALVVGAAACLLIADRLRLRLMAGLAAAAASVTPALVSTGESSLHALMSYQLLVIGGLVALDARRRWPELATIGLVATWALAGVWAGTHFDGGTVERALLGWSVALLAASAGAGWRLLSIEVDRVDAGHGLARLLLAGLATWLAAALTLETDTIGFAVATALLSGWHVALAVALRTRASSASEVFLVVAWLQALLLGRIRFDHAELALWWTALGFTVTVIPWAGLQRVRRPMLVVPALAAMAECVTADEPWSLPIGLLAAAVLLTAAIWPGIHPSQRPIRLMSILATAAWGCVVAISGPISIDSTPALLGLALVPNVLLIGWSCWRPSKGTHIGACVQLGLGLFAGLIATVGNEALTLHSGGEVGTRLGLAFVVLLLAALGATSVARLRPTIRATEAGLLTALVLLLSGLLTVAGLADGTRALGQVGYSLTIAGVGLALIIAGLRMQEALWRQAGLAAIAVAAAKIVLIDLDAAAVGWRALSFVGLGAILIGGSFAYSRAARRATLVRAEP